MVRFTRAPAKFRRGATKGNGEVIRAGEVTRFKVTIKDPRTGKVKSFTRSVRTKGKGGSARRRRERELKAQKIALEKKLAQEKAKKMAKAKAELIKIKKAKVKTAAERKAKEAKVLAQKFKLKKIAEAIKVTKKIQKKVEVRGVKTGRGLVQIGVGVGEGLKEVFVDPVAGSFNYGRNLVKRAEQKGSSANKILRSDLKKVARGSKDTAKFVKNNPGKAATLVGASVAKGANLTVQAFKKDPTKTTGKAIAYLFPGTIIKGVKTTGQTLQKLNPKYVKEVENAFKLKNKNIWTSTKDFLKGPKKELPKEFAKNPNIILKKQTVSTGARSLSEQTKFAGKVVTAVNASANQITTWIGRKKLIRKPIPGENKFPKSIKASLKKFDAGVKLTKGEFAKVNKWLRTNVAPNITLLERSLYLDPTSGLRVSRLGIGKEPTARLRDIFKGAFKFQSNKPQVLIFQNAKVAKFPKQLKDIEKKLKANKKLTEKETNRLIAWQVKTGSGKFKPVGSTIYQGGKELEVTLAPGEFIKRIKKVGFTFIEGKKVNFVTAEVYKPSKKILDKINKAKKGELKNKEVSILEKDLSKQLGTKVKIETPKTRLRTRPSGDLPVLRVSGSALRILSASQIRPRKPTGRKPPGPTGRKPPGPTGRKPPGPTGRKPPGPTGRKPPGPTGRKPPGPTGRKPPGPTGRKPPGPTGRKPPGPTGRKPPGPTGRKPLRLSFDSKLPRGKKLKFDIKFRERKNPNKPAGKANPVITKTRRLGLPLNKAIKKGFGAIDRTTQASAQLVISGITSAKDLSPGSVASLKAKFGVKKGKTALRFVEKSKARIDTRGEKKGLSISKVIKKKKKR